MSNANRVMGIDELAVYLNMSRSTLYKLSQEGKIPGHKFGRHWRYDRERINEWLASTSRKNLDSSDDVQPGYGTQLPPPDFSTSSGPNLSDGEELKKYFTAEQIRQLHSCSIRSIATLLVSLATNRGKHNLTVLLKITAAELDKIATRIADDVSG